jgi:hypothetical protein
MCSSAANRAVSRAHCWSVSRSAPVCSVRADVNSGSPSAPVPLEVLLDPAAAVLQCVTGQADDVEGIHHGHSVGQLFRGSGLQPGEPVHREDFHAVAPGLRSLGEPLLERLLRAALDHVQQP